MHNHSYQIDSNYLTYYRFRKALDRVVQKHDQDVEAHIRVLLPA